MTLESSYSITTYCDICGKLANKRVSLETFRNTTHAFEPTTQLLKVTSLIDLCPACEAKAMRDIQRVIDGLKKSGRAYETQKRREERERQIQEAVE